MEEEEDIRLRLTAHFEAVGSYQSRMFEASAAYNQIIVLGGYVAFFTLWSTTAPHLSPRLTAISGVSMLVSVAVYVGWTIANMVLMRAHLARMLAEIAKGVDGFLERVQATEVAGVVASQKVMRFWLPVLVIAGGTAAIAAILLGIATVDMILQGAGSARGP